MNRKSRVGGISLLRNVFEGIKGEHERLDVLSLLVCADFGERRRVIYESLSGGDDGTHVGHRDKSLDEQNTDSQEDEQRHDDTAFITVKRLFSDPPEMRIRKKVDIP